MQFKHPEVFYFLVLLLIPIIVHLFQLQKFKKIAFTNVSFLKKISLETRKSSRLKKWLILASRLLGFLALLFVFSQPYISEKKVEKKNHNFIYLDNSISLATNGNDGNQLKNAARDIIEYASNFDIYTLITNDQIFKNLSKSELENMLKKIEITSKKSDFLQKILEIESRINSSDNSLHKSLLVSDFQKIDKKNDTEFANVKVPFSFIKINSKQKNNISLDSVSVSKNRPDKILIYAFIRNQGEEKENIPVALYNDSQLINKRSFSIDRNETKKIEFLIPKITKFKGKIQVTFSDIFMFDNLFYFNISSNQKTNILNIGKSSNSLSKIFAGDSFNFSSYSLQNTNYNRIPNQQLIILNQLEEIPNVLQNAVLQFVKNGGHLLIVPDKKTQINSYNSFFRKITDGSITGIRKDSLKITEISYKHPLYTGVFSKKVSNFQYPIVFYSYNSTLKGDNIISFENKAAFLQEIDNSYSKIYWFSAPLDAENTNFSNSPLIVPTFFNMGQQSLKITKPYYTLEKENIIEINKKLEKDQILVISNQKESFIPLQQSYASKVRIATNSQPKSEGFYQVSLEKDTLETIAYNIPKEESSLLSYDLNALGDANKNIKIYDSIKEFFTEINQKNKVQWFWKLFLAIAIVSLLLEILILKFFKT